MRLIDADKLRSEMENYSLQVEAYKRDSEIDRMRKLVQAVHDHAVVSIETISTIDVETLPIVKQLRHEFDELNEKYQMLERAYKANRTVHDLVCCNAKIAEIKLNAAIEQLHGYCPACKHYTPNHNEGPCEECKHEYYQYRNVDARDNWEWKGAEQNERTAVD